MTILLKGLEVANTMTHTIQKEVDGFKEQGIYPKLAIVRVGESPSDLSYEKGALKRMEKCGIKTEVHVLSQEADQSEVIKIIKSANEDASVHGILMFRPLPKHMDETMIQEQISPEKDVDGMSMINFGKVMAGEVDGFPPATPAAVMAILKHYQIEIKGKHCVIVGRSTVVGKPVAMMLLKENGTVTISHSKTENLKEVCRRADILVVAIGRGRMITKDYVKNGAVVIDVGINIDENNQLCGDVNEGDCMDIASALTPVPGGVGSVTTSILAAHVLKGCKTQWLKNHKE